MKKKAHHYVNSRILLFNTSAFLLKFVIKFWSTNLPMTRCQNIHLLKGHFETDGADRPLDLSFYILSSRSATCSSLKKIFFTFFSMHEVTRVKTALMKFIAAVLNDSVSLHLLCRHAATHLTSVRHTYSWPAHDNVRSLPATPVGQHLLPRI